MSYAFIKELWRGKSISRTLQNFALHEIQLSGNILDVAGGKQPSYKRFLKTEGTCQWKRADFNNDYNPDFCFDATKTWPIEDNSFDWVLLINCLYIFSEPVFVLKEARRVLKKGGQLLFTAPLIWHESPEPTDYFRYTSQGIEYLVKQSKLEPNKLIPYGGRFSAAINLCQYYLRKVFLFLPLALLAHKLDRWVIKYSSLETKHPAHCGYIACAKK